MCRGNVGQTRGGGSGGAANVPLAWHVLGGAVGTHGSGSRHKMRGGGGGGSVFAVARKHPPDASQGYPLGTIGRGPISAGATNGTTAFARRPAAGVAMRGVLRDGAPVVGQVTAVATNAGPRDIQRCRQQACCAQAHRPS